ncbi:unnamed protein product [Caenorhabditis auriculariae]|uniref:Domain of unknown function DX domain-containing protein n=1 Tax=Caenorhabditis auriculariae TaxID=2777116 RepID=A0A8S1H4I3_9PELO|nr:unnamed protein product [Caenorhabditis auriculariae]
MGSWKNLSDKTCDLDKESRDYDTVEVHFSVIRYVMPFLAIAALLGNLTFIGLVFWGIRHGRLPLKRYLMVINRSVADIATTTIALTYFLKESFHNCDDEHICYSNDGGVSSLILQVAFMLDYWAVALSYSGIALLTWYAVRAPLAYKIRLTSATVTRLIIVSWAGMSVLLLFFVLFWHGGELNFNGNAVIHLFLDNYGEDDHVAIWLVDLCVEIEHHPPYRAAMESMLPPIVFYLISLTSYMLVSQELFHRRGSSIYKRHHAAMWRLGSHLLIFSTTCLLMGAAFYGSLPMEAFCKQQKLNGEACMDPVVTYTFFAAAAVIGWFLRMIIDAAIDMFVDGVLRRAVFGRARTIASTATMTTADRGETLGKKMRRLTSSFVPRIRRGAVQFIQNAIIFSSKASSRLQRMMRRSIWLISICLLHPVAAGGGSSDAECTAKGADDWRVSHDSVLSDACKKGSSSASMCNSTGKAECVKNNCCAHGSLCGSDYLFPNSGEVKSCSSESDCSGHFKASNAQYICTSNICCVKKVVVTGGTCPDGKTTSSNCADQSSGTKKCQDQSNICYKDTSGSAFCCAPTTCGTGMWAGMPTFPTDDVPTNVFHNDNCGKTNYHELFNSNKVCCPLPFSYTLSGFEPKDHLAVGFTEASSKSAKKCSKQEDCGEDEFCDGSYNVMNEFKGGLDASGGQKSIQFCFKLPKIIGKAQRNTGGIGLKVCNNHVDCKEKDMFCYKMDAAKKVRVGGSKPETFFGICSKATCTEAPLSKDVTPVKEASLSDSNGECTASTSCVSSGPLVNSTNEEKDFYPRTCSDFSDKTTKFTTKNVKLCCYQNIGKSTCDGVGRPLLDKTGQNQAKCSKNDDCLKLVGGSAADSYCVKNVCCRGAGFCPDKFTARFSERPCTGNSDCNKYGKCVQNFCCPMFNMTDALNQPQQGPYCTLMKCQDLHKMPMNTYCGKEDKMCYLGLLNVAGKQHFGGEKECTTNKDCSDGTYCVNVDGNKFQCFGDPFVPHDPKVNKDYMTALIACIIMTTLCMCVCLVSIVCYRSSRLIDAMQKRKKKKGGKKGKGKSETKSKKSTKSNKSNKSNKSESSAMGTTKGKKD